MKNNREVTMHRFLAILREEEYKVLKEKTGWGRNQLKEVLEIAKQNAIERYLKEVKQEKET